MSSGFSSDGAGGTGGSGGVGGSVWVGGTGGAGGADSADASSAPVSEASFFQRRSWPVRSVRFARPVPGRPSVRGSVPCPRSRWSPLTRRPRRNGRCVRNARIWQDGRCRRSPVRHGRQRRPHPRRSPRFRRASRLPRRRCRQERSLNRWRSVDGISRSGRKCPMPGAISTRLRRPGNTARNRRIPAARRARSCRCAIRPRVCAWS